MTLAKLFNRTPQEIEGWAESFRQKAAQIGLPFGPWRNIYNSRLAQELGLWAEEKGKGDQFHLAAFSAYLVEDQNLAAHDVLLNIAESSGLPADQTDEAIISRSFQKEVDEDWSRAMKLGINSVPTMIMDGDRLVGAHPYEQIKQFVLNNVRER